MVRPRRLLTVDKKSVGYHWVVVHVFFSSHHILPHHKYSKAYISLILPISNSFFPFHLSNPAHSHCIHQLTPTNIAAIIHHLPRPHETFSQLHCIHRVTFNQILSRPKHPLVQWSKFKAPDLAATVDNQRIMNEQTSPSWVRIPCPRVRTLTISNSKSD